MSPFFDYVIHNACNLLVLSSELMVAFRFLTIAVSLPLAGTCLAQLRYDLSAYGDI